jgi:hypothetical protein
MAKRSAAMPAPDTARLRHATREKSCQDPIFQAGTSQFTKPEPRIDSGGIPPPA